MEKSSQFSDAAAMDADNTHNSVQETPEVTTASDFSYFDDLQREPMTTSDMFNFTFLVALPTVFFVVAIVLMHVYND